MDQLCIDQNNNKEKGHEISKMREYYGNSAITLIAIHTNIGEEIIRKLSKSFEVEKSGLVYPDEIIKNSLPILEKIIGSD
jgi:mRNA degradation ribonuclease J1/J2